MKVQLYRDIAVRAVVAKFIISDEDIASIYPPVTFDPSEVGMGPLEAARFVLLVAEAMTAADQLEGVIDVDCVEVFLAIGHER